MLVGLTGVRLVLVPAIIATFMTHPAVTTVCLGAFMLADLFDGVAARALDADGASRRALDSVVDRIAIDACMIGAGFSGAMPIMLVLGFLARDLYCSALSVWMFRRRGAAIKADLVYRGLSFLVGVWALSAPFIAQPARVITAAILLALALVVAADLTRGVRRILRSPRDLRGSVVPAGDLRRRMNHRPAGSRV
jgi:phosphatidylglycerophosphate synthase